MASIQQTLDAAIDEATKARARVSRIKSKQVRGIDEVAPLKATGQRWFYTHKPIIEAAFLDLDLGRVDHAYTEMLAATSKHATRQTYLDALRNAKGALIEVQAAAVLAIPKAAAADDTVPDFSPLARSQEMRDILGRRWQECYKCVGAGAHLAAIVMMGGLLEALFVARANTMTDKAPLIAAVAAPKDRITGVTVNYQQWMLDSYIKVARELGWITESAKDVADVLKEYRNYVHPEKERRHGVVLELNDSAMFWQVTKALVRQLLLNAGTV